MSELNPKLIKLIPADAKLILEISILPGLAEDFGAINPFATYL
jgi:hypothetical protein